jgi:hypothetical protein
MPGALGASAEFEEYPVVPDHVYDSNARGRLTRARLGIALVLAAIGAIAFGSGIAGAAPQQPLLVDSPVPPIPAPAGPDPTTAVNIANTIFGALGPLLTSLFPGSGSSTGPLSPGYPNTVLPGQAPAVPYSPGAVLPDPSSF